ncbi:MAG: immunoglobulin domain-containing protein [Opitutaceae bacterium]|nr:immunoglobulin domain-containing protein [Opitutaceae bacterium]
MSILRRFLALLVAATVAGNASAWVTEGAGWVWPHGTTLSMQKDFGAKANLPGATWNALADNAIAEWNANMAQLQLTSTVGGVTVGQEQDDINQMFFSNTVYGDAFGAGTVGVAIFWGNGTYIVEGDIVFNSGTTWTTGLFQTVALHELGHVLGLGHPDEDGQTVSAVMNSHVSIDHLSADDIAGIQSLYNAPAVVPAAAAITTQPVAVSVAVGGTATFTVAATGEPSPTYQWRKNTVAIEGATATSLTLSPVRASDAANYSVSVSNTGGSVTSVAVALTVTGVVTIVTPPAPQTVTVGATATFSVSASGSPAPNSWQWKRNGTAIGGATASTLTLPNVQISAAGDYSVTVSNGIDTVTSASAALTVNLADSAPTITAPPTAQSVDEGRAATFSVTATGKPAPSYQWLKNGNAITGATTATLTFATARTSDAGNYSVRVANYLGNVTSPPVALTVNTFAPTITTQPAPQRGEIGGTVAFSVTATGAPFPSYQWQKDGNTIVGATLSTLTLTSIQTSSAGNYRVVVTNSAGSVTSNAAALTVNTYAPTITAQPASRNVNAGASATFSVTATGSPVPTYQWQKDGTDIAGATNASRALANVQLSSAGNYRVHVTNSAGSLFSEVAVLTVNSIPVITTQPVSQTATAGTTVTFTVAATQSPVPTYQWQKDLTDLAGATQATLTLASVQTGDAGSYRVMVTNTLGTTTSVLALLTVTAAPTPPVITAQPESQIVNAGSTATLYVLATGTDLTYQWRKAGVAIAGATQFSLSLRTIQPEAAGSYSVVVTNTAGSATSREATITVHTVPAITQAPIAQSVEIGDTATFTVAATGSPVPTYQWQKNRVAIAGATQATLTLTNVQSTAAGNYRVVVTNAAGSATSAEVALTVSNPPKVTTQPQPLGGVASTTGSLAVAATGATGYQWFKGGVAVPGATGPTLAFPALGSADTGIYDCAVTGLSGETLSAPGVVGIVPAAGERTAGSVSTRPEWQDIHHPNGATYDQFLLSGAAGTFTAGQGKIARLSYLDENDSIVQVEMSGAGAITVVLANPAGPMAPTLYNQSGVQYMKGKATVILAGADATTHFTIYSVGTATNPGVTRPDVTYAGWANVAAAGILSTTGGLGGIHQGNVGYNASTGLTGIYAPTVTSVGGLVVIHGVAASESAQPYLYFGPGGTATVKIAGTSLAQSNGHSVTVGGLAQVQMGAGQDSCGRPAPASAIGTRLLDDAGVDRTAALVVGP